ncbi:SusD/RagB family nutrient-binding outer membrane lipoprotein [Olivibacter sp. XZL3]|uniref:SusD/RagB family nutrient-binding outer membrane lipoprotein n=1 Tax=Olivibacter sp. XZL3 TaxID=1735116 RepID=UPI0010659A1C|nr:SusD/RagB family nutrient-binding outer membrane lipoprotein [Olivibacter sp. XZL3]
MNIKQYIKPFATVFLLGFSACTKDFEEINVDPNKLEVVSPGSMLTPVIYNMSTYFTSQSYNFDWQLMQVCIPHPSVSNGIHRYDLNENSGNGTWNTCYTWLANIREMETAADNYNLPVYRAVAATLRAYIVGILTDSFGDVPFLEAMQAAAGITQPRFDTQQEIYEHLIAQLEEANTIYATDDSQMFGEDLLYSNDKTKWQRFNNSLLLRLLLRASNRPEMNSYERLQAIISNPEQYPVFTSNDEAAFVTITGNSPYDYAWGRRQDYANAKAMASFFVDLLNEKEDPRRALFMTRGSRLENGQLVDIGYVGVPAAHSGDASQFNFNPSQPNADLMVYTTLGTEVIEVMMSYAEVELIKAEVALRAGDLSAAQQAYEKGIVAGITQWKNGAVPVNYLQHPAVAFDGTMKQLMEQKYIALFYNDYQQWFEYRRTGLPELPKTEYMLHDGVMPKRFMYPTEVRRYNPTHYQEAADRIGGDNIMTKVWWEK